ncbi:hypothetical protein [Grimontia marina]|uniref:Uncharacterized protein n=1 Tax=Grimontia marina TaxID=646534 RepID=A0A128FHX9_9GAMM|nr:hypothetical protein [Grimontia marina]CZF86397.1 hypothetical protein GMA8713_04431 [Grimontia marina]
MIDRTFLYTQYFQSLERFNQPDVVWGYEPDVVYHFIQSGVTLASYHELGAENESPLLAELYLRQVYFALIEAIRDPERSQQFRHVCLNMIHEPLIALKRFYKRRHGGEKRFLTLQHELQRLQAPLD